MCIYHPRKWLCVCGPQGLDQLFSTRETPQVQFASIIKEDGLVSRLVRGTPTTTRVLLYWVIMSQRWEQIHKHNRKQPIKIPHIKKKCCGSVAEPQNSRPQKTPRTDTILPEHLLAHTLLIIYVYSQKKYTSSPRYWYTSIGQY